MAKNDGGPAFPAHGHAGQITQSGMTLRQWYAGQALAGMMANSDSGYLTKFSKDLAEMALLLANALIAAEQEPGQ